MPQLSISLLGTFLITRDGSPVNEFDSNKVRGLLAYLAVEADRPHTREALSALLWPDWPQESALNSLRNALAGLRRAIGDREANPPYLLISRETIQFNPDSDSWLDVTAFAQAEFHGGERIENLAQSISLYRGPFLEGFSLPESSPFEEWLILKREQLNQHAMRMLRTLANHYEICCEYERALVYARKLVALEPWLEEAHRLVMGLYAFSGQRSAALAQFETCKRLLASELGLEPANETKRLYECIRTNRFFEPDDSQGIIHAVSQPGSLVQIKPTISASGTPDGAATFLVTEIVEGETLWDAKPEELRFALQSHHAILRLAANRHEGIILKIANPSCQVVFRSPQQAILAAVEAQQYLGQVSWGENVSLKIRMGLHTGLPQQDGLIKGTDIREATPSPLEHAARLGSTGHGGQILVSQVTAALVQREIVPLLELKDLGRHRIRRLAGIELTGLEWSLPEHIFQVCAPGLPEKFPPLRTLEIHLNNLPQPQTSFIGREKEISEIKTLLQNPHNQLVTLTGAGGVGKTRLALHAALDLLGTFTGGVWLVELAALADPAQVALAVASALNLHETSEHRAVQVLYDFLQDRHLLLILDNCEHLKESCAELAENLLQTCPRLRILATSRQSLDVLGETTFCVPSLSIPGVDDRVDLDSLFSFEAVRLFVERARNASPLFPLTAENSLTVAQICQRLDGIPLAIELAAARVRLLNVGQIAARLENVFGLLTRGTTTPLPRHQTLRASVDWSYQLLTAQEQSLLQKLSVFAGGWTLEAAEAVCENMNVLDLLDELVDKSLVTVVKSSNEKESRFRMLEFIRQYALEKLEETGETEQVRNLHLAYFLQLAARAEPELRRHDQLKYLNMLDDELDNLRAALGWALQTNPETELRLVCSLMWYWDNRSRRIEALEWLDRGLALGCSGSYNPSPEIKARALLVSGCHHAVETQYDQAKVKLEESLRMYREMGPKFKYDVAFALRWLGFNEYVIQNYPPSERFCRESLVLCRELNDPFSTAECLYYLFMILDDSSDHNHPEELQVLQESLALFQEIGDLNGLAAMYGAYGWYATDHHDPDQARHFFFKSSSYYQQVGDYRRLAQSYDSIGMVDWRTGEFETAYEWIEKASTIRNLVGNFLPHRTMCYHVGWLRLRMNQVDEARLSFEGALAFYQKSRNQRGEFYSLLALGVVSWKEGAIHQTVRKVAEAAVVAGENDDPYQKAFLLGFQWAIRKFFGDEAEAETCMIEALRIARGFIPEVGVDFFNMLAQSKARHQPEKAARLFGAAENLNKGEFNVITPLEQTWHQSALEGIRTALGEQRLEGLMAEGKALSFEEALCYALEGETIKNEISSPTSLIGYNE